MTRLLRPFRSLTCPGQTTTLVIAGCGGALFVYLHFPLAWMLGAMVATSIAAMSGVTVDISPNLRNLMMAILGILLGSSFRPDLLAAIGNWGWSIGGLVVYLTLSTAIGTWFLRRVLNPDPVSAYFAATPGGMNEMVLMGGQFGGKPHFIALSHSVRILMVVFSVPLGFALFTSFQAASVPVIRQIAASASIVDHLLLTSCVFGGVIADYLRIPAGWLVGPMLCSAVLHLTGMTEATPLVVAVCAAQVAVGASLGIRFRDFDLASMGRTGAAAFILTTILLVLALGCSWVIHTISGLPMSDLFLAYSPGGFTEMSLVGLSLGSDTAFVSAHHMFRISLIAAFAPAIYKLTSRP